jgi:hypothetical protein
MILYDPAIAMRFPDYGIQIPVLDSRADRIVDSWKSSRGAKERGSDGNIGGVRR